jgi:hypothetical protein
MKYFFVIASLFLLNPSANSADDYKVGDTLYVWSKQGLKLRDGANASGRTLMAIPFGARIVVVGKTDHRFNIKAFGPTPKEQGGKMVDPVIFYGSWCKIRTAAGEEGYVIDQYLLSVIPVPRTYYDSYTLNLRQLSTDTISSNYSPKGWLMSFTRRTRYANQIEVTMYADEKSNSGEFRFSGFSIEEALVIFLSSRDSREHVYVYENKSDYVALGIENCILEFRTDGDSVIIQMQCSC